MLEVISDRRPSPSPSLSCDILLNMWSVPPGAGALWHLSTAHRRFRAKLITVCIRDYSLLFNTDCVDVHFTSLCRSVWPGDESRFKRNAVLKGKKNFWYAAQKILCWRCNVKAFHCSTLFYTRFGIHRNTWNVCLLIFKNKYYEGDHKWGSACLCRMSTRLKETQKNPSNTEVYLLQKSRDGLDGRICEGTLKM